MIQLTMSSAPRLPGSRLSPPNYALGTPDLLTYGTIPNVTGWVDQSGGGGAVRFDAAVTATADGSGSLQLQSTDKVQSPTYTPAKKATRYTLTWVSKSAAADSMYWVMRRWHNGSVWANDTTTKFYYCASRVDGEWTRHYCCFTTQSTEAYFAFYFCNSETGGAQTTWIDDLHLYEGWCPAATAARKAKAAGGPVSVDEQGHIKLNGSPWFLLGLWESTRTTDYTQANLALHAALGFNTILYCYSNASYPSQARTIATNAKANGLYFTNTDASYRLFQDANYGDVAGFETYYDAFVAWIVEDGTDDHYIGMLLDCEELPDAPLGDGIDKARAMIASSRVIEAAHGLAPRPIWTIGNPPSILTALDDVQPQINAGYISRAHHVMHDFSADCSPRAVAEINMDYDDATNLYGVEGAFLWEAHWALAFGYSSIYWFADLPLSFGTVESRAFAADFGSFMTSLDGTRFGGVVKSGDKYTPTRVTFNPIGDQIHGQPALGTRRYLGSDYLIYANPDSGENFVHDLTFDPTIAVGALRDIETDAWTGTIWNGRAQIVAPFLSYGKYRIDPSRAAEDAGLTICDPLMVHAATGSTFTRDATTTYTDNYGDTVTAQINEPAFDWQDDAAPGVRIGDNTGHPDHLSYPVSGNIDATDTLFAFEFRHSSWAANDGVRHTILTCRNASGNGGFDIEKSTANSLVMRYYQTGTIYKGHEVAVNETNFASNVWHRLVFGVKNANTATPSFYTTLDGVALPTSSNAGTYAGSEILGTTLKIGERYNSGSMAEAQFRKLRVYLGRFDDAAAIDALLV